MSSDIPLKNPAINADACESVVPATRQHSPADVFDEHFGAVYRYLSLRLNNLHAVEDLSSQCFLRLVEKFDRLKSRSGMELKFWLLRTASNLAKEHLRNACRRKTIPFHAAFEHQATSGLDVGKLDWPVLYKAILELPERYQEVVVLRYIEEYEIADTARILNKRETTVRSLLHRACKKLRHRLSTSLGD